MQGLFEMLKLPIIFLLFLMLDFMICQVNCFTFSIKCFPNKVARKQIQTDQNVFWQRQRILILLIVLLIYYSRAIKDKIKGNTRDGSFFPNENSLKYLYFKNDIWISNINRKRNKFSKAQKRTRKLLRSNFTKYQTFSLIFSVFTRNCVPVLSSIR